MKETDIETELKKLSLSTDNLLNDKQKQLLHLTSHSVENFRHGDIASRHDLITGDLVNDFVSNIQDHCPLINSVLESLVEIGKTEINVFKTNEFKFKCASHALAALLNIRSSKSCLDCCA